MKRKNKIFIYILMIIFLIMFIYSGLKIINYLKDNKDNRDIKKIIDKSIVVNEQDEDLDEEDKYTVDFLSLRKINSDTVAYLKVNGTNIDYVVVRGEDNSYYLKHNFNKEYNISGWIFSDFRNKFDNTDKNIIIFGHNTRDESMFGSLKNVLKQEWYSDEANRKIVLVTERGNYLYEVFSTYQVEKEEYYIKTDFYGANEFIDFVKTIKSRSIYDYNIEVGEDDSILTLSSCIGDGRRRVVLHAKKIENINY